jgi:hypothetical protein
VCVWVYIQNIVLCVTIPGRELLIVCYLVVATAIIYAHFGLQHYEDMFYASGAEGEDHCYSASSCFWLILFKAAPAGKLSTVMAKSDNRGADGGPDFMLRVLFDISFFIWVGILLFNIITVLMIDTFNALREKATQRANVLGSEGFVCGITRIQFDDLALPNAPV